jgi:G:T-mismatch repair DNA endonuclease (very short patch repair protein)
VKSISSHATSAEVTEGSSFFGGVWERPHYDWSQPGDITITVQSSNAFTSGSFWHYHIMAGENGGSHVDFTLHRVGKNLKGRVLATMLRVFGRRIFRQDLEQIL